jgi:hypothetical protein
MWSFLCILLDMSTGIIKSLRNFLNFEVSISRNACDYMFQGRLCGSMMFLPICYIDKCGPMQGVNQGAPVLVEGE